MGVPNPGRLVIDIVKKNAVIIDCCCFAAIADSESPRPSAASRKTITPIVITAMYPRRGTANHRAGEPCTESDFGAEQDERRKSVSGMGGTSVSVWL